MGAWTVEDLIIPTAEVEPKRGVGCISVQLTMFGVMLYAAAHNQVGKLARLRRQKFGDFTDVGPPDVYGSSKEIFSRGIHHRRPLGNVQSRGVTLARRVIPIADL